MAARIRSSKDLVTAHKAVCEGFLLQALTKTEKATPFIKEASALYMVLNEIKEPKAAARRKDIRTNLLSAAGFSEKAISHLSDSELTAVLERVMGKISEVSHDRWKEEIVYRYLLTKGDSLGGSMRNITGALAGKQISEAIIAALTRAGKRHDLHRSARNREKVETISWDGRLLFFDRTPRCIGNNIDMILLNTSSRRKSIEALLEDKDAFIACGEVKGGIDPAGADEHWKTARSALNRIRQSFPKEKCPALFFVGAAIEPAMAKEIYEQLEDGRLTLAANLTVPEQVQDLGSWIIGI